MASARIDDREHEVQRHEIRVQLEEHDEAAEHDLGHDAADEARRRGW